MVVHKELLVGHTYLGAFKVTTLPKVLPFHRRSETKWHIPNATHFRWTQLSYTWCEYHWHDEEQSPNHYEYVSAFRIETSTTGKDFHESIKAQSYRENPWVDATILSTCVNLPNRVTTWECLLQIEAKRNCSGRLQTCKNLASHQINFIDDDLIVTEIATVKICSTSSSETQPSQPTYQNQSPFFHRLIMLLLQPLNILVLLNHLHN